ncbi:LIM-domain-containing protein, partial [Lactarius vividus]
RPPVIPPTVGIFSERSRVLPNPSSSPVRASTRPASPVKSAPGGPSRPYATAGSSAPRPVSPTKSALPSRPISPASSDDDGKPSQNGKVHQVDRGTPTCGGCGGPIVGRIVSAMGVRWHPGCFRCSDCDDLLEYVSSYERDGKPYCHFDYHERFAPRCYHCKTAIVDERFITLDDPELGKRTYHEQHFFCSECGDPFLAPSIDRQNAPGARGITFKGDGEFENDDVGFTVYKGYPYCEACHVRLRSPKCKKCKNGIRDGMQAVEALGGKYHWECFCCTGCEKPFDDPSFFLRENKPFCERCYSIILKS